jgi:hypothetical protein
MAASGCVTETFSTADQNTSLTCVKDAQVLLNNVRNDLNPTRPAIATDGFYGALTEGDVANFQLGVDHLPVGANLTIDGILGPQTWSWLCAINEEEQFTGAFWHNAGCATEV